MSIVRPICQPIVRPITRALTAGGGFVSIVTDGVLAQFVTFTRASTGTYFDSAGVMQTAAINVPRLDYDPAALSLRGLLVEEQRTNLLLRSQEFDNASWTKEGVTVSANAALAPDGSLTAETLSTGTSFGEHRIYMAAGASAVHSHSIYAKAGTANFVSLSTGNTTYYAVFDLGAGVVSSSVNCTSSIVSVGGGWYRLSVTGGVAMPAFFFVANIGETAASAVPVVGSTGTNKTVHLWGAQLEAGAFATSYVPTTTAAVTRAIDDPDFTIPSGIVRLEYTYDDDTTADVAVTPGAAYQIPTSQKRVKFLRGYRL